MGIIPTRIHGILDYIVGVLLISAPWIFNFNWGGAETWVPVVVGVVVLLQTIMTDFELGLVKLIPMRMHLIMDLLIGIFLAASPWIFGFSGMTWAPHVIFGLFSVAASFMSRTVPDYVSRREHAPERDINRRL